MLDTLRYFICWVFEDEFNQFRDRFTDYSDFEPHTNDLMGGI